MLITRGLKAIQNPQGKSKGRCECRHLSPDETSHTSPRRKAGFLIEGSEA